MKSHSIQVQFAAFSFEPVVPVAVSLVVDLHCVLDGLLQLQVVKCLHCGCWFQFDRKLFRHLFVVKLKINIISCLFSNTELL